MHRKSLTPIALILLAAWACNLPDGRSSPSPTPIPEAGPTATPPSEMDTPLTETDTPPPSEPSLSPPPLIMEATGVFHVAILVDLTSEPVAREAAEAVLREASSILQGLIGFVIEVIDYREIERSGTTTQMAFTYLDTLAPQTPNGLVIFSYGDNDRARLYGGYSEWVVGPQDYRNAFVSPVAGDQHVYLAVIHWSHHYAACGYGGGEEVISETSIGGECRNQPGTACVQRIGYSMCVNAVDDLYASTPTYFLAANIVHEFMHPFGGTSDDHYATPRCMEAMGWTDETWTFSLEEAQIYNGQCPNLSLAFDRGYRP